MKGGSLRDYDRLADRIRLHHQVDKRPVIIVEGPSDERILKRAFGDGNSYFSAGTRNSALEEAQALHNWKQNYFTCVVDRDFDDTVAEFESQNIPIHAYENADLEAMLSVSGVAASLIAEFGSATKIEAKGGITYIIDKLFQTIDPVTRLRRANIENSWGLTFDAIDLRSKIDKKSLEFKVQSYCAALNETSDSKPGQNVLLQYATGELSLQKTPSCPRGTTPYFRGRDFLALLSTSLCGYCGTRRSQSVEPEILEASLRLGGSDQIRTSSWGRELMAAITKHSEHK
ncbi:DUF4435 domain-containing protein [Streptomyces sp. HU2014]|uniref:DUF4435 domain-containing protein n=1 Tax=Streptomyces sp. HU2014 TaxID=2939414 RepID=UPI00200E4702|nr:DUF4435 domain-containing protein [Streptomyces sp. HU2014]UQI47894.1 DUF4435 domain-containing protein [Streptomyces sp. HU2014]